MLDKPASWVVRHKDTGRAVYETYKCPDLNLPPTTNYEVVTILQHLQDINTPGTPAYEWARRKDQ